MLCTFGIIGCCKNPDYREKKVYIKRVYMNEVNRYTFITKNSDGSNKVWEISGWDKSVFRIYDDVPVGKEMYVEYSKKCQGGTLFFYNVNIHIHNLYELQGGSWNHGKFGKGQTQVIK